MSEVSDPRLFHAHVARNREPILELATVSRSFEARIAALRDWYLKSQGERGACRLLCKKAAHSLVAIYRP
jgi:hypothetical protein